MNLFRSLIMYWSDRIEEETEKMASIRIKLNNTPHIPLTQREVVAVRHYLVEMETLSLMLTRDVVRYDFEVVHKKSFIKKLFRK
jgi:hypothetical protein